MNFLYPSSIVIARSAPLAPVGAEVSDQACNPVTRNTLPATIAARSLLSIERIRFM